MRKLVILISFNLQLSCFAELLYILAKGSVCRWGAAGISDQDSCWGPVVSRKWTPWPKTIKKFGAWIGAQLTILCSINRKLRSGDYKETSVFCAQFEFRT